MANKEVSSVRVFARFRPTRSGHTPLTDFNIDKTLNQIRLGERHRFRFDGVLSSTSTQDGTYQTIGHTSVIEVLKGYNATVLAYGQTGSGKSYSMVGYGANKGIVPIACDQIFKRIGENTVLDTLDKHDQECTLK